MSSDERLGAGFAVATLAAYSALVVLWPQPWVRLALVAVPAALALLWWTLLRPARWMLGFVAATLLLPPLPLPWGQTGPHPALIFAALGVWVGLARANEWRTGVNRLCLAFALFFAALVASVPWALLWSGPSVAAGSVARLGLLGIALFACFYFASGPGRFAVEQLDGFVNACLRGGVLCASLALVDFYYQFAPPAGFGEQYIWLSSGVYRRAQGMFYDAGMLGNFSMMILLLAVAVLASGKAGPSTARLAVWSLPVVSAALFFSFSRSALLALLVAGLLVLGIERRLRFARRTPTVAALALIGATAAYFFARPFIETYLVHLWSAVSESPELSLSGRWQTWRTIGGFLAENPLYALFGIGYKTLPHSELVGEGLIGDNMYLTLLLESGVLGVAAFSWLCFEIARVCLRARRSVRPLVALTGTWLLGYGAATLVQMMSVDALTYWRVLPIPFAFLGLISSVVEQEPDENPVP